MTRIKNYIIVGLLICGAMIPGAARGVVIDKIVAVVNGEVITQRELTYLLVPIYERYKQEYRGKRLEAKMVEAEDKILDQLIDDKLILSEAKRAGIEVSEKEIDDKMREVRDRFGSEDEFRQTLAGEDVTVKDLRERFKNEIMKSKIVHQEAGPKTAITPSEVREYYDSHPEEFLTTEKVSGFHILIKAEKGKRTRSEALFLIEQIKESVESGKDFQELAKEYSEGPNAKEGGQMGPVEKGQMIKEIDEAIFSLEAGEVSSIVESPLGYHLFKITEKVPARTIEFESAKADIEEKIFRIRIDKSLKTWLKKLKKDAYISVK